MVSTSYEQIEFVHSLSSRYQVALPVITELSYATSKTIGFNLSGTDIAITWLNLPIFRVLRIVGVDLYSVKVTRSAMLTRLMK